MGFAEGAQPALDQGRVGQHPAVQGGVVHLQTALQEQLLDVAIAERVAQVPRDGLQDQRCLEVPALEIVLRPALQLLGNRAQDHRPPPVRRRICRPQAQRGVNAKTLRHAQGENARATYKARKRFGPVHVLDPFGITGLPAAAYNPLDGLDPNSLDLAEDAATIADALVHDPPGQVAEAHWNEEAKALLTGLILYAVCHERPEERTLATVRDYLSLNPENFQCLLKLMQDSTAAGGLIARAANRHLSKADREAAGVLSSAQRHTHFLDSPRMAAVLARSDFRFAQLKDMTGSVFLVLPPDRLGTYSRWLRLMVAQAITDMARSPVQPPSPVLFLLDEFAALGPLEPMVRAYGLMAGYGMQLWAILQDLHQLKSLYGPRAGPFLSNAGVTQVFNVNDIETATWISKTLGATTEAYETSSQSISYGKDAPLLGTRSEGTATHLVRRDLLTPDEVMRLPSNCMILLRQGSAPILASKVTYYADPEFRGLFGTADASPPPSARADAVPAE